MTWLFLLLRSREENEVESFLNQLSPADSPWSLSLMKPEDLLEVRLRWFYTKTKFTNAKNAENPFIHFFFFLVCFSTQSVNWFCCSFWDQAPAVLWSGPQEAAGGHRVFQQIRRVPALQSQTHVHLLLPPPNAECENEVWHLTTHPKATLCFKSTLNSMFCLFDPVNPVKLFSLLHSGVGGDTERVNLLLQQYMCPSVLNSWPSPL